MTEEAKLDEGEASQTSSPANYPKAEENIRTPEAAQQRLGLTCLTLSTL